jgi:hypothetical protein
MGYTETGKQLWSIGARRPKTQYMNRLIGSQDRRRHEQVTFQRNVAEDPPRQSGPRSC